MIELQKTKKEVNSSKSRWADGMSDEFMWCGEGFSNFTGGLQLLPFEKL